MKITWRLAPYEKFNNKLKYIYVYIHKSKIGRIHENKLNYTIQFHGFYDLY